MAATSPTWLLSTGNVINLKEDACCMCNTYAKYEKKSQILASSRKHLFFNNVCDWSDKFGPM